MLTGCISGIKMQLWHCDTKKPPWDKHASLGWKFPCLRSKIRLKMKWKIFARWSCALLSHIHCKRMKMCLASMFIPEWLLGIKIPCIFVRDKKCSRGIFIRQHAISHIFQLLDRIINIREVWIICHKLSCKIWSVRIKSSTKATHLLVYQYTFSHILDLIFSRALAFNENWILQFSSVCKKINGKH